MSYMIPEGLEGLVKEPSLGCVGITEGLGSVRYVEIGRDGFFGHVRAWKVAVDLGIGGLGSGR